MSSRSKLKATFKKFFKGSDHKKEKKTDGPEQEGTSGKNVIGSPARRLRW